MKTHALILLTMTMIFPLAGQSPYEGRQAVVREEFIFRPGEVPFPSCHASTVEETPEGPVAAWFGGKHEKAPDVRIWVSRYDGRRWSRPRAVADGRRDGQRYPTWNPVLFGGGDSLYLFFKVGPSPRTWWGEVMVSHDGGSGWSAPRRLPAGILGPIKDKPIRTASGWILSPSSTEDHGWRVHLELSGDGGATWTKTFPLNDGKGVRLIQPTLLEHPGGRIQMLCRSKERHIFTAWSQDGGLTWGPFLALPLPNPNSGIDAVRLRDGRYLLVYNHVFCKKGESWGDRNILNVALSDDGLHWQAAVLLENDPDPDSEYSYPAVIQTSDGKVHITYTWNRKTIKHVVIDPEKIVTRPFTPEGKWPEE